MCLCPHVLDGISHVIVFASPCSGESSGTTGRPSLWSSLEAAPSRQSASGRTSGLSYQAGDSTAASEATTCRVWLSRGSEGQRVRLSNSPLSPPSSLYVLLLPSFLSPLLSSLPLFFSRPPLSSVLTSLHRIDAPEQLYDDLGCEREQYP